MTARRKTAPGGFLLLICLRLQICLHYLNDKGGDAFHLAFGLSRQSVFQVLGHTDAQLGVNFGHNNHSFETIIPPGPLSVQQIVTLSAGSY